ncbi:MAG: hypothetical protein WCI73_17860, partial [Phycisphaerae bacterium]
DWIKLPINCSVSNLSEVQPDMTWLYLGRVDYTGRHPFSLAAECLTDFVLLHLIWLAWVESDISSCVRTSVHRTQQRKKILPR